MDRLSPIPLTGGRHDRAASRRRDDAWLAAMRAAADTRIVAVRSHSHLLIAEGPRLGHAAGLPADAELTFLGVDAAGGAVFVCDADLHDLALGPFEELRTVGGQLSMDDAALAAQAVAMVGWHRRHRFCGICGGATLSQEAGHSRRCVQCEALHFPRTDPAVIMVVTDGSRCVLSRRQGSPLNRWTVLSGFVEPGETPEEAVVREVREEVGLCVREVKYVGSQPWPFPASLMLGYEALAGFDELTVDDELEDARWFSRADLRRAMAAGELVFPPSISISRRLIMAWLDEG